MNPIDHDLELAEIMLSEMHDYLLSKETFWPLGRVSRRGEPAFPKLTPGALILTFDELEAQAENMSADQVAAYQDMVARMAEVRQQRGANLAKKALAEMKQRLNLWQAYLSDLKESAAAAEQYPGQVKNRVLLDRLRELAQREAELGEITERVQALDNRLRRRFSTGPFVWHPRLRPIYPEAEYWYLYGQPAAR